MIRVDSSPRNSSGSAELQDMSLRQSNIVKPTSDDIRIAKNRAETALKRADLEYQKEIHKALRKQDYR